MTLIPEENACTLRDMKAKMKLPVAYPRDPASGQPGTVYYNMLGFETRCRLVCIHMKRSRISRARRHHIIPNSTRATYHNLSK